MRRNTARLTPTKAPSPSTGPPSHSRTPSRTESLLHFSTISEDSPPKGPDASTETASNPQSNARRLEELKRQMEQTLVNQQVQHQQHHDRAAKAGAEHSPQPVQATSPGDNAPRATNNSKPSSPSDASSHATSHIGSSGSNSTIKGPGFGNMSPGISLPKTPSYPFPVMPPPPGQVAPEAHISSDTVHTTNSRDADKSKRASSKAPGTIDMTSSLRAKTEHQNTFYLPEGSAIPEDHSSPTPNIYDLILKLNSEPGLESWWANVVDVLQTHYGIERASLAVPGDSTDLENLPWVQKATFNPEELCFASELAPSSDAVTAFNEGATQEGSAPSKKEDFGSTPTQKTSKRFSSSKRPSLLSRHSFAGFSRDRKTTGTPLTTTGKSSFDISSVVPADDKPANSNAESPSLSTVLHAEENALKLGLYPSVLPVPAGSSSMAVFTAPRVLEAEDQPLVKQSGIAKLFGRTKPAVLTREYAYESTVPSYETDVTITTIVKSPNDIVQTTPASEPSRFQSPEIAKEGAEPVVPPTQHSRSKSSTLNPHAPQNKKDNHNNHASPLYDEYEQAPSSPWSQSPAPSPAPRIHPEKNPFFTNHAVDETAFAMDPPSHDYAQLEPVAAIGVDRSKSVVHVPLLHSTNTKLSTSDMIRFPVAILSFLSPVVPYPANLRSSLMHLIPHLTSSYSLAHQYSQLERQLAPGVYKPRFGNILGLGGTFSDASSELELVAGLSGQAMTDGGSVSARASISSPDEGSNNPKYSPSLSVLGTPGVDMVHIGPASEPSATPAMGHNVDHADGYFNLHQVRSSAGSSATRTRGSKSKPGFFPSMPVSPGVSRSKSVREEDLPRELSQAADQIHDSGRPPPASMPTRASSRNTSTTSVIAHLQREGVSISEHIFQLMLNSVPLHLFLAKAPSGEVIWTNSKFDAYRRSQPQDQSIRDPWQNIHPNEVESISKQWSRALQTGAQFTERVRVKRFNDENAYRWFIFRANPLLSQTGQVISWIGSFLDIHEQHVSELRAAQEREIFATNVKYRALANSIPQIVFEATELRGLISANEQWHLYTGQHIEEAMNFGFTSYVHPDDLRKCGALSSEISGTKTTVAEGRDLFTPSETKLNTEFPKLFAEGITPGLTELVSQGIVNAQKDENGRIFYTTELRLRSRGGDYRWHLVRLVKVEASNFGDGEASWYGTCTDINDRKILERELNKAMQKLNREMESKSKFFSNMSHEIRTPLNGILGTIPFILDTQLDNEQRRMLDTIQNSSTNLRELVDNILDVSRVEAGKMNIIKSWFHLRSVLEDVIDTISSRAIDKGLEINYLMDTDVPDMVVGDRFRIRQVLINLMGNAVKFTSQGEIYTRCSVHRQHQVPLKDTELFLNFEVVDTGKGFSAADAERLMQRFSQLGGNASQQNAGSGLGLFLSKQLVEMHGGKLTPSSREGQGAKFSFYIKVDAPPQVPDPSLTRQPSDISDAPTATSSQGSTQLRIPLLSKSSSDSRILTLQDLSPALDASPLIEVPSSVDTFSLRSGLNYRSDSSAASAIPTPDLLAPIETAGKVNPSGLMQTSEGNETVLQTTPTVEKVLGSSYLPPVIYSVLIICPLDHAREAVRQHIEQVIPLEVPATSTALSDIEDWKDLKETSAPLIFSHIVLDFPGTDEVVEALQHVPAAYVKMKPSIVIICDLFQKRQISNKIEELISSGFKVVTIPKPVKPSAFSSIFDPDSRRDLSKDRNQDMAREVNNNFKTMTKMVKEVIGNKGYRILLVEDDETNRGVMLKYLDKVKVVSETAGHGQECLDMVFSHEPGYYSLIICDIQMPIKNGYDTCREIRAWEAKNHFHQIPIMALSANAMTDQIDVAARAGFNDYVTKPIKHNELGKMMMTLLDPNTPQTLLQDRKDWQQQKS